jgi:hypothetical protein
MSLRPAQAKLARKVSLKIKKKIFLKFKSKGLGAGV